jgi:hypothetical protein
VDVEARSRLESVLSGLEHESAALADLRDDRLGEVLELMGQLEGAIVTAIASLAQPQQNLSS